MIQVMVYLMVVDSVQIIVPIEDMVNVLMVYVNAHGLGKEMPANILNKEKNGIRRRDNLMKANVQMIVITLKINKEDFALEENVIAIMDLVDKLVKLRLEIDL